MIVPKICKIVGIVCSHFTFGAGFCSQLFFGCFHMILQQGLSIVALNVLIDLLSAFFYMFQR